MIGDPNHVLGFEAHLGLAKILYDWNQFDEAEPLAQLCTELVALAKSKSEIGADLLCARLKLAKNEPLQADILLARTSGPTNLAQLTDRTREAAELRVQQMMRRGEWKEAADLAHAHQLPAGLTRILLAQGKGLDALRTVESYRRTLEAEARVQDSLKLMVLQVVVYQAIGQLSQALQLLRDALTQAQAQGSIRLFVDEGAPVQAMLGQLPYDSSTAPYVAQLLAAFDAHSVQETPSAVLSSSKSSHLPLGDFSQREMKILRLIQEGNSNQNIGERLFLSLSTVKWHNQNIFAKLDVKRRTEAVARAMQLKLL